MDGQKKVQKKVTFCCLERRPLHRFGTGESLLENLKRQLATDLFYFAAIGQQTYLRARLRNYLLSNPPSPRAWPAKNR